MLIIVLVTKRNSKKLKDNSYVNTYDLHANASKEYLKDLGLPKTILDSSKITELSVMIQNQIKES